MSDLSTPTVAASSKARSKVTNDPLRGRGLGRSPVARRTRDLFRAYHAQLGSPADAGTQALVLSCAEQVVGAEQVRASFFAGRVSYDDVIRAEGSANRALRRLGLNKPPQPKPFSIAEALAAQGILPPGAASADEAVEQRGDETPLSDASNATAEPSA